MEHIQNKRRLVKKVIRKEKKEMRKRDTEEDKRARGGLAARCFGQT